jgi:tRNA(adenine34) deaminase
MCLGAAMALGVARVYYGLEAPDDGAAGVGAVWRPARQSLPASRVPVVAGGYRRRDCREQFERYAAAAPDGGLRRYAADMAAFPDDLTVR